jgi:hypothetical protein
MPAAGLPDGTISTARYAASGPVPEPVTEELRLGNWLGNLLNEYELDYEKLKAAAWEEDPQVAPVLAAVAAADEAWQVARDESSACKQKLGYAKKTGITAKIDTAQAAATQARQVYRAAVKTRQEAAAALRDIKGLRWHVAKAAISAAAEERDRKIAATYPEYRDRGGYWANWTEITKHHKIAVQRVRDMRKQGQPAQLRYHRFDGTGTVIVQIQRELGVTPEIRAQVTALKAAGHTPGQIEELTGVKAMVAAKMKPDGPVRADGTVKEGDPPCNAAALADEAGKWRSSVRLTPELPAGFEQLPRHERRRIARQGMFAIRTGAVANQAVSVVPVTVHRPMHGAADVKYAKLTVTPRILIPAYFCAWPSAGRGCGGYPAGAGLPLRGCDWAPGGGGRPAVRAAQQRVYPGVSLACRSGACYGQLQGERVYGIGSRGHVARGSLHTRRQKGRKLASRRNASSERNPLRPFRRILRVRADLRGRNASSERNPLRLRGQEHIQRGGWQSEC